MLFFCLLGLLLLLLLLFLFFVFVFFAVINAFAVSHYTILLFVTKL